MSYKIKNYLIIVFVCCSNLLFSQSLLHRIANQHLEQDEYEKAIGIYTKILEKNSEDIKAKLQLARAYRAKGDLDNAAYWYGQSTYQKNIEPIHYLHYGQVLQQNGKCESAKIWFRKYVEAVPDDLRGQYLERSCNYRDELLKKNKSRFSLKQIWFNSKDDDFSPTYYRDGLVFASDRVLTPFARRAPNEAASNFANLYTVKMVPTDEKFVTCSYIFSEPNAFAEPVRSPFHEASAAFSTDFNEIFFTRSHIPDSKLGGIPRLEIYYARILREKWTTPERLPFNSKTYSVAHPALSGDGKFLFFASDMPGGYGGMDLYRIERVGNRWGEPINLGRQVNTEGNEVFPTIDNNGRLFFASNGHVGLGGLDIYSTEELQNGTWSFPENLGSPINTLSDDFGLILNKEGTCGFFTSNRAGGMGKDDIYGFTKEEVTLQVQVLDQRRSLPIINAAVENQCDQSSFLTNRTGKVFFDMPINECCNFTASIEGYESSTIERCTDNLQAGEVISLTVMLKKILNFKIKGTVFDSKTGLPMANATVNLYNSCGEATQSVITNGDGRFEFELSEDCCYSLAATRDTITSRRQVGFCTKDKYESQTFSSKIIFGD